MIDAEKILDSLVRLWADQRGLKATDIEIRRKNDGEKNETPKKTGA